MKTTRAARDVITIADIEALESRPDDELIPARTLIDLLRRPAHSIPMARDHHSSRGRVFRPFVNNLASNLHKGVVRAANLFHYLLQASGGGRSLSWGPSLKE